MTETLLILAPILLSVAFFTLAERKLMAINHNRKGPNKVSYKGILQPMADAAKLLTKEWKNIKTSNKVVYVLSPLIGLAAYCIMWVTVPFPALLTKMNLSMLFLVSVLSTTIMFSMSAGWSSNSKFTILGSYRSTAQAISYEVSMAIFILSVLMTVTHLNSEKMKEITLPMKLMFAPILTAWMMTVLAETSRTPFDFTESESELASGFNTEFYGVLFSIFFIAEYLALIFMAALTALILVSGNSAILTMVTSFILMIITIVRMTLPRSRYDKLMMMAWLTVMPVSIITITTVIIMYM